MLAFAVVNVLLVWVLARRLFADSTLIAAGGALLFAVFPARVESVAWLAGRSHAIVGTFMPLTMPCFLDRRHASAPWLGGSAFSERGFCDCESR